MRGQYIFMIIEKGTDTVTTRVPVLTEGVEETIHSGRVDDSGET